MQTDIPYLEINISNLDKETLLRVSFILELTRYNIGKDKKVYFSDREYNVLCLLYMKGGLNSKQDMDIFTQECFDRGYIKVLSTQTIRNILTKARSINFLKRKSSNDWKVTIIPNIPLDNNIVVKCLLTDYAI